MLGRFLSLVRSETLDIYDLGDRVSPPVPLAAPRPQYTTPARRAKIQGTVRARCLVRPNGACSSVTVIRSLDRAFGLDDEAVRTPRAWRFRPALLAGRPVATWIVLDFTFALR